MHQILIVRSEEADARSFPYVSNVMSFMQAVCPLKVLSIFPVSISHILIVASSEQEAIMV